MGAKTRPDIIIEIVRDMPQEDAEKISEIFQDSDIPFTYDNIMEFYCVIGELESSLHARNIKRPTKKVVQKLGKDIDSVIKQLGPLEMAFHLVAARQERLNIDNEAWGKHFIIMTGLAELLQDIEYSLPDTKPDSAGRSESLGTYSAREGITRLVDFWENYLGRTATSDIKSDIETLRYKDKEIKMNVCGSNTDRFVRDALIRYQQQYLGKMREWLPKIIKAKRLKE
jgi:hypothetical protein